MEQNLVSVVMPAYNSEKYLAESIESVLNQTFENFELIVVDDGSTDNTAKLVSGYQDDRVRYFFQESLGSGAARNLGIRKATGNWIAFLDSDDLWEPSKLEMQLQCCSEYWWSHSDAYYLDSMYDNGTRLSELAEKRSGEIFTELLQENFVSTSCVMVRKELLTDIGGFDTTFKALQDWNLWIKIASKYEICYCDLPLGFYRVHSDSVSRSARKTLPYHLELITYVYSPEGIAHSYKHLKSRSLANSFSICSHISEQESDYVFSIYCAYKALTYRHSDLTKMTRLGKLAIKILLFVPWISLRDYFKDRSGNRSHSSDRSA